MVTLALTTQLISHYVPLYDYVH